MVSQNELSFHNLLGYFDTILGYWLDVTWHMYYNVMEDCKLGSVLPQNGLFWHNCRLQSRI